jgi:O-antigen/teichoic acid export membrane protein
VWALVFGGLATAGARTLLSEIAVAGPRNRFGWDKEVADHLVTFGRWIFISTLFTVAAMRVDFAMLGRLVPVDTLGIYSIGVILATVVRDVLSKITLFVVIPALSVSHRAGHAVLTANYLRLRSIALPAALLAVLGATVLAPPFFQYLYDPRYHAAIWIAQLSMGTLWFAYLTDITGSALLAIGDSRAWAIANIVRAFATAIGCAVGFWIGGLPMLLIGSAIGAFLTYLVAALLLRAHGVGTLRGDLPHTLVGVALGFVAVALPLADDADGPQIAFRSLLVAPLVLVPYGIWVGRRLMRAR